MTYAGSVDALAQRTEARAGALWDRYESGQISRVELEAALTVVLVQSEAAGTALGDAGLAAALTVSSAAMVVPVGVGMDEARPAAIGKAVATLLDRVHALAEDLPDRSSLIRERTQRLGRSVASGSSQNGWSSAMKRQGVARWRRRTTGKSCAPCVAKAHGTLPTTTPMWRHNGCDCIQEPVGGTAA